MNFKATKSRCLYEVQFMTVVTLVVVFVVDWACAYVMVYTHSHFGARKSCNILFDRQLFDLDVQQLVQMGHREYTSSKR